MAITPINIGAAPNDGTGDPLRDAFEKVNNNDASLNNDIGQNTNDITALQNDKADKVQPVVDGNLAELDATGNLVDSGKAASGVLINPVDAITFNTTPPVIAADGSIYWCDKFFTPKYNTGLGVTIRVGVNEYYVFYNDTGAIIPSGKIMHLLAGADVGGQLYPTFEFADPRDWEKIQGTLGMTMHDVPVASLGILAKSAQLVNTNTTGVSAGTQLWIKPDGSGDFTDTIPQFPNIPISIGGSYDSDANGAVFFNITSDINELFDFAWDGSIVETFDFLVTSDGVTVTGTLTNDDNTRDLPIKFSTGLYTFDTTTAPATIALTAGTDTNPQTNYVYIPESTKLLTVSTGGWPVAEHAKVAQLLIQSAATTQLDGGALKNQNVNDHIKTTGDNGHILHIAERIRKFNAEWDSGTESTLDSTGGNGYVTVTGGNVWQLHKQTFPALDMATGDVIKIVNDFTTPYRETGNLNTITAYSDGSAWSNEWSKIVIWGVANKSGEASFLMCNIPSDGYNSEANAIADALNYADYSIPDSFKGVGFLIGSFAIRISGGSITYNGGSAYQDLRGFIPNNIAGGGGSGGGGVTSFLGLTDTPSTYAGQAGSLPVVNAGETALEFLKTLFAKINFDAGLCVDTAQTFLPENGVCFGNGGTGFYELVANSIAIQCNNDYIGRFTPDGLLGGVAGAPYILLDSNATAVLPVYTFGDDTNTGIGKAGADQLSLIAGGVEGARVKADGVDFANGLCVDTQQTFLLDNGICFGDGDTSFREVSDDILRLRIGNADRWIFDSGFMYSVNSNGLRLTAANSTSTVPNIIPSRSDQGTGIGWNSAGKLSIIASSTEAARIEAEVQKFYGQVIGGDHTETFSATPTFNFNNGNVQEMTVTANVTSWTISNELPAGSYTIYFIQDGTGGFTIADPTGITKTDFSLGWGTTANDINVVNVIVTPSGISIAELVRVY